MAVLVVENLYQMSLFLMLLCSFFFYRYLKNIKRERKLTVFEFTMYIITLFTIYTWAFTFVIKFLSKS
ncbi:MULTISPECIES: hypothetical protein [Bacillus]|uniref:Uncharacterized protein n=1 Tax=Bacillus mycoides TaxID=1405 RepID=A0A3D9VCC6_BACMY|nr:MULTISPECIES: hypothetical protein [Bacillus]MBE7128895.1 hypothetical protein [Bacillus mycoides]RBP28793.1 hypothetical protein DET63_104177 [Bacillus sp. DB-2]REF39119.1 hypothetical protein DET55_10664 [Bacillus mycoides]VXC73228.1 conserved hypothetical protein [Bacillus mycoides]